MLEACRFGMLIHQAVHLHGQVLQAQSGIGAKYDSDHQTCCNQDTDGLVDCQVSGDMLMMVA